jgi:Relaxase/Mobilisation nuclease domain
VIVNGSSNRCVDWWASHLESEENEKVHLVKSYGLRSATIPGMLEEMMDLARGTNCQNPFYQINMNPASGEVLSDEQWDRARQIAEKQHGLEGQAYFMVIHIKHGREHPHFVYSRIKLETMRAISDSHDARKNHAIARRIEREFGLRKVIGPYDREPGTPRPKRAPRPWEMYRDKQHGLDTRHIQTQVTGLLRQSENGKAFKSALEQHGYELVTGRRGLLILDSAGHEHSLARRCGMPMKQVLAFMREVDLKALPAVEQAKAQLREQKRAGLEAPQEAPGYSQETPAVIWPAYHRSGNAKPQQNPQEREPRPWRPEPPPGTPGWRPRPILQQAEGAKNRTSLAGTLRRHFRELATSVTPAPAQPRRAKETPLLLCGRGRPARPPARSGGIPAFRPHHPK